MNKMRHILTTLVFGGAIIGGVFANNLLLKTAYCNVGGSVTPVTVSDSCVKGSVVYCLVHFDGSDYYTFATPAEALTLLPANRLKRPAR